MVLVNLNPGPTSVLEKCSKSLHRTIRSLSRAAAVFSAVALISVYAVPAFSAVTVQGLPDWLVRNAEKSLNTVWAQMEEDTPLETRQEMIRLVAGKLFAGYVVAHISSDKGNVEFFLEPRQKGNWRVSVVIPPLNEVSEKWFSTDAGKVEKEVSGLLLNFPPAALAWADFALESRINEVVREHLQGWETGIVVKVQEEAHVLEISFSPSPPLVLAFDPMVDSTTIPYIFRSELEEGILKDLSGFTGLPVEWLAYHKNEFEDYAVVRLSERNTVRNSRAKVDISVVPDQISKIQAMVESGRYSLHAWLAVYVGADEQYPEFGLHLGRITQPISGWDLELYGEFITRVDDLDLESRWGMRWSPLDKTWIGLEYVEPDDLVWYRLWYTGSFNTPYLWWRYSSEKDHNFALGWNLTRYFSLELLYDERYEDNWSIRLLNHL
ncbi:MAG: hypothetical protein JW971_00305 [Synergistales bacterium]|nr:hypothetical protein [Synergistales bacterium]